MGRFNEFYITCTLADLIDYLNLLFSTVHLFRSVSVVTLKLTASNKTSMAAILKALSAVMNENRRNKVFTMIRQLKMREYSKDTYFSLNYYINVIFISVFPQILMSCILKVIDRQLK